MNRFGSVHYITVHHDGISPFYDTDTRSTADRIDRIRRYHRDHLGWGDIGYHYIIDRSGRIWEGRPLQYQGAHVRDHNENNLGVLLLGNFEQQQPSSAQLQTLQRTLNDLMRTHRVSSSRILTHREWEGAATICPGRSLQHYMDTIRNSRALG